MKQENPKKEGRGVFSPLSGTISFAEAISKLTITYETETGLLKEWEGQYHIHATVLMKKLKLRIPISQRAPKREPTKRAYDRSREKNEVRKEHSRSEGREN